MGLFSRVEPFLRDQGIRILACTQCSHLKVTFIDQVSCVFVSNLDPSAATVKIIGTTQPEEIITDPAEGVANEM